MYRGLYLHIPFCEEICNYCDFKKEKSTYKKRKAYVNRLVSDIKEHSNDYNKLYTIYIGGGTPLSLEVELLELLLSTVKECCLSDDIVEYTIETNPENITQEKIDLLKKYGVSRISIGVQSFHNRLLKKINRTHTKLMVLDAICLLRDNGFYNISVDMMFALPTQTMEELEYDIKMIKSLNLVHVSYYSLILEEKTVLDHLVSKGDVNICEEGLEALMYRRVIKALSDYNHYEISNFAKQGYESKHNILYWILSPYLGLGVAAHSLDMKHRYYNTLNTSEYIEGNSNRNKYVFEAEEEYFMLGLRMLSGVSVSLYNKTFGSDLFVKYDKINEYIKDGYLEVVDDYLRFTLKGLLVGNEIFGYFVGGHL